MAPLSWLSGWCARVSVGYDRMREALSPLRLRSSHARISTANPLMKMDLQVDKADLKTPENEARQPLQRKGEFITFEGGEGTGKSTQAAMRALRLEALGIGVLLTRERWRFAGG